MFEMIDWVAVAGLARELVELLDKLRKAGRRTDDPRRIDAEHARVKAALLELLDPAREPDLDEVRRVAEGAAQVLGESDDGVAALRRQARNIEAARRSRPKKKAAGPGRRMNGGPRRKKARRKKARRK